MADHQFFSPRPADENSSSLDDLMTVGVLLGWFLAQPEKRRKVMVLDLESAITTGAEYGIPHDCTIKTELDGSFKELRSVTAEQMLSVIRDFAEGYHGKHRDCPAPDFNDDSMMGKFVIHPSSGREWPCNTPTPSESSAKLDLPDDENHEDAYDLDLEVDLDWNQSEPPNSWYPSADEDNAAIARAKARQTDRQRRQSKFAETRAKEPEPRAGIPIFVSVPRSSAERLISSDACGLYRYRDCNEIVYIGKGKIRSRLSARGRNSWSFDEVEYADGKATDEQLYHWEAALLAQFAKLYGRPPRYNLNLGQTARLTRGL